jgi:chemotaxis protein CheX
MEEAKITEMVRAATQEVFQTMLMMDVEPCEAHVEKGTSESYDGLVALVGIAGKWTGLGSVYCTSELAMRVTSTMFMVEQTSVNLEVLDAMSELANMIIGNVKSMLETELGPLGLSIPTVIYGRNYRALSGGAKERLVVPFICGGERLDVKVCLIEGSGSTGAGTRFAGALHTHHSH